MMTFEFLQKIVSRREITVKPIVILINSSKSFFWRMLLIFFLLCEQTQAGQLTVLTTQEPPMSFKENNEVKGIVTDIVKEIIKRTGNNTSINLQPWKRAYRTALNNPNVVLFTVGRTQEREGLFHWIGPIITKRWVLIAKRESSIKLSNLDDAKKAGTIGAVNGDARENFLVKNGIKNIGTVTTLQQAYQMLMLGRVALVATADVEIPVVTKEMGLSPSDVKIVYILKDINSYIAISKGTPKPIIHRWKTIFTELKKDGTFKMIGNKWAEILDINLSGERGVMELKTSK